MTQKTNDARVVEENNHSERKVYIMKDDGFGGNLSHGQQSVSEKMKVLLPDQDMSTVEIDLDTLSRNIFNSVGGSIREPFDKFTEEHSLGVSGIFTDDLGMPDRQQLKLKLREFFNKLSNQRLQAKIESKKRDMGKIESVAKELGIEVEERKREKPLAPTSKLKYIGM